MAARRENWDVTQTNSGPRLGSGWRQAALPYCINLLDTIGPRSLFPCDWYKSEPSATRSGGAGGEAAMFGKGHGYNFADRVRGVLARARAEAGRLNEAVAPEHILLGLIADRESLAMQMLHELRVSPELLRERLALRLPRPEPAPRRRGQEFSGAGKRVLERAMTAARALHHDYIGTEHILLGILAGEGPAVAALTELGVTEETARGAFASILRAQGSGAFRPSIDDTSASSIYEQIVAQVKEAVATGRLRPLERLPTVRQLADELDIAPGTVARAYGELERRGVVTTDGARGTRVAERAPGAPNGAAQPDRLVMLLRPVTVAAFHMGATAEQLRAALEEAMRGISWLQVPTDP